MRYIDAFNHFFPKRYYEALLETPAGAKDLGKRMRGIPALVRHRFAAARRRIFSRITRRFFRTACRRWNGCGDRTNRRNGADRQ